MLSVNIEDLPNYIGQEVGKSEWMAIDQDRINLFADAIDDHQWIHVDSEKAKKELPTKKTIAHGFLTLSLMTPLSFKIWEIKGANQIINYGLNKVRFLNMVPSGSRVRLALKIKDVKPLEKGGQKIIGIATMEIEGERRSAYIAEFIAAAFP
ncbi:MAG: MaoC family dehydratase [Bdellovibrionota bacterium]|nr:MaoC family dehydratase [Bdellovibrionota bacterium]